MGRPHSLLIGCGSAGFPRTGASPLNSHLRGNDGLVCARYWSSVVSATEVRIECARRERRPSMHDEARSCLTTLALTRLEFEVTTLAAGFALAVRPVSAQTMITTDANGLDAGEVKVPTGDGEIPAYRAMPASGGPFPVVLVVQ